MTANRSEAKISEIQFYIFSNIYLLIPSKSAGKLLHEFSGAVQLRGFSIVKKPAKKITFHYSGLRNLKNTDYSSSLSCNGNG